jgi:hypothetical protein
MCFFAGINLKNREVAEELLCGKDLEALSGLTGMITVIG